MAAPALRDPNFDRTVVLILEHGDDGAIGVVLNRPLDLDVDDALPGWQNLAASPPRLFQGGPVGEGTAIVLGVARLDDVDGSFDQLFGRLGSIDVAAVLDAGAQPPGIERLRVFSGYAGWGAGQLEDELSADGWFVLDADIEDAVSADPGDLWSSVLLRQGGAMGRLANYPPHPWVN